jgi:hypothetical protein
MKEDGIIQKLARTYTDVYSSAQNLAEFLRRAICRHRRGAANPEKMIVRMRRG